MRALIFLAFALFGSAYASVALAQSSERPRENPSTTLKEDAERGWFFYEREKKPPEPEVVPEPEPEPAPAPKAPEPKEDHCKKKETWTAECGFVDPGKDFAFQEKQRDALLQAMSLSKNEPQAVENFQYYMKWLMARSLEVANLWQYNLVQNPALDATVKSPINTFGLRLMTEVRDSSDKAILDALKQEKAFLLYFSRYDCNFCQAMSSTLTGLATSTGLDMWNSSLDGQCMPGFESRCKAGAKAVSVAQALQVSIVPTLFLHVPGDKSENDTWIRIATGVTDEATMRGRIVSFFSAYRTALLKGVANGAPGRAPVDFSENEATGAAPGVAPAAMPTPAQIKDLFEK